MENIYLKNRNIFNVKFSLILTFLLLFFSFLIQSQTLVNSFTTGNGITGQVPLYPCESQLNLNISYSVQNTNSIVLYFPNSFDLTTLPSNYVVTDSTNGFVEITFPVSNTGQLNFTFQLSNCLNDLAAIGSVLNISDLRFQAHYEDNSGVPSFSFNNSPMQLSTGTPAYVTFQSSSPAFQITPTLLSNYQGNSGEIYYREFEVKVNSTSINTFDLVIEQENDVQHQELILVDNNPTNGISPNISLNNTIGSSIINSSINLNTLANYYSITNNLKTLKFRQKVQLFCVQPNTSSIIKIERICCSGNNITSANMYGRISGNQTFANTYVNLSVADSTVKPSCGGLYNYDILISKTGPIALIDSIDIALNANYISGVDSIFIGNSLNNLIPILGPIDFTFDSLSPNNSILSIDLINNFSSSNIWPGFQSYIDSTQLSTQGPWLNSNFFYLRIKFNYDCNKQQSCFNSQFYLQGKSNQVINNINSFANTPIKLYWKNSCESDYISSITPLSIQDSSGGDYIDAFVNIDHDMAPDRVRYFFYPSGIIPSNILGLACDSTIKYRAVFHIPVPDDAINPLSYNVQQLYVNNDLVPIDNVISNPNHGTFINNILSIPLGSSLDSLIIFSFDYNLNPCPFGNPPNSGGIQLLLQVQAFCASCEECYKTLACNTLNVVAHCPGECDGFVPMGTKSVNLERSTFGFRDTTDFPNTPILSRDELTLHIDSLIDISNPSLPSILRESIISNELTKLYPFDIVKLSSIGTLVSYPDLTVNGSSETFEFQNISFELAHTIIGDQPLLKLKNSELYFIDSIAADSFSVPLILQNINPNNSSVFGMSGDTLYSFELGIDNLSALPQLNSINTHSYKLRLNAEFWVLPDVTTPINPVLFRGQFICSTNMDSQLTTYSCDPWGTQLKVLVPSKSISIITQNDSTSHCISEAHFKIRLSGGLGTFMDDFPYEFRPFIGYADTAYSSNFIEGYAIENGTDTLVYSDTLGNLWFPNQQFLHPLEKPGYQDIFIKANKFCSSGSDTIHYKLPFYDFAYLSPLNFIDPDFVPTYLTVVDSLRLNDYSFYDSVDVSNHCQFDIQKVRTPNWIYTSPNVFNGLFSGLPMPNQIQGIAESDSIHFDLHIKSPDSLQMGNCWLSYGVSSLLPNSPNLPVSINPFSPTIPFLNDSLSVIDSLGVVYHFFQNGFPIDSMSTQLAIPVVCGIDNYRLSLNYGCFCITDSFEVFKENVNRAPQCFGGTSIVNFHRDTAYVNRSSQLITNNDSSGCGLTWLIDIDNPINRPNIVNGKLLINIPSGLVLNTGSSTFEYFLSGDSLSSQSGNYLNDTIDPNYSFQFEDFPTPPTTVLVLAFPSVDTLYAGAHLQFALRFKLDQSTCNLSPSVFQSNFLYRILEATFTGYTECNDSALYTSNYLSQSFINNASPSTQSQISAMAGSPDCCLQSAATVSIAHPCNADSLGIISLHFNDSSDKHIQLYKIELDSILLVSDLIIQDTILSISVEQGLYSATVTTNGGLIYVFNALEIQNHGVQAQIILSQNSLCGGSPILLHAVDSNATNNLGFNNSNPFIATDTLVTNALTYQWSINATADSLNNSIAYDSPINDTSYSVIVSHLSGCIDTASIDVSINEISSANILQLGDSICASMNYLVSVSPVGGIFSINGLSNNSFVVDPSSYISDTLMLTYSFTNDSGCVSIDTAITISSNTLCNCQICDSIGTPLYIIPANVLTTSQLATSLGLSILSDKCIQLNHSLTVDNIFEFNNCDITIAGGKEIKVTGTLKLDSCNLKGCEQMWNGINNLGKLKISNCNIKDAHYGILLRRFGNAYSNVDNTIFENNFVAIKSGDELGEHPLALKSCSFIGGQLLQTFPNQSPLPLGYSLAGIVATNYYNLYVTSGSRFKNLCNGVILNKYAYAKVYQSKFENIQPFGVNYQGSSYWLDNQISPISQFNNVSGNGIYASTNSFLFVGGFSQLEPNNWGNNTHFNNCNKGVFVNASDVHVRNCSFDNVNVGVRGLNLRAKSFKIMKNKIASKIQGVSLMQSDFMLNDTIGYNTITSLPLFSQLPQVSFNNGIFVSNQFMGRYTTILANKITSSFGISVNSATGIRIQSDTIVILPFTFFNSSWDIGGGIYMSNTNKSLVSCNIINGNTTTRQFGVNLTNSRNGIIKNNYVNNSRYGFKINGNCQTDSFKLNTIVNHQYGVDISAIGILGNQINNGNKWTGSYSITPARRQSNNSGGGSLSSFVIHNPSDINIYPIFPPFQPFTGFCEGDFFYCDNSFNSPSEPYCSIVSAPAFVTGVSVKDQENLARLLAYDSLAFDPFTESIKFSLSKDIFQALNSQELILPDTGIFVSFIEAYQQSPAQNYVYVDQTQVINETSESTDQIKKGYLQEMKLVMSQIDILDSTIIADNLFDDEQTINQRATLATIIYQLKLQLELIDNNVLDKQGFARDSSFLYNNGVVTNIEFEDFERRINKIYLNTVAQNNLIFDEYQVSELYEIAHLCPALGGSAVFKARSLYALINDTALYNDDGVCLQQGIMYRMSKNDMSNSNNNLNQFLRIYPNPTTGKFIIRSILPEHNDYIIKIMNSMGQSIYNKSIRISGEFEVDVLNYVTQGLYLIQVFDNTGLKVINEKLIKR